MVISNCELLRAMYILRRPLLLKNEDCFMSWILFWRWCWILLFVLWKFYIHSKSCTILAVVLDTDFERWKAFGGGFGYRIWKDGKPLELSREWFALRLLISHKFLLGWFSILSSFSLNRVLAAISCRSLSECRPSHAIDTLGLGCFKHATSSVILKPQ